MITTPAFKEKSAVVKADIVERVYERVGFTRQEAVHAVDVVFEEIKSVLGQGEDMRIVGFASFNLRNKKERMARNPKTGEPVLIKPKRVLTFKPSKQLLAKTNQFSHDPLHSR